MSSIEESWTKTTFHVKCGGKTGALLTGTSIVIDNPSKWKTSSSSKPLHIHFRDILRISTTDKNTSGGEVGGGRIVGSTNTIRSLSRHSLNIHSELLRGFNDKERGTLAIQYVHKDHANKQVDGQKDCVTAHFGRKWRPNGRKPFYHRWRRWSTSVPKDFSCTSIRSAESDRLSAFIKNR